MQACERSRMKKKIILFLIGIVLIILLLFVLFYEDKSYEVKPDRIENSNVLCADNRNSFVEESNVAQNSLSISVTSLSSSYEIEKEEEYKEVIDSQKVSAVEEVIPKEVESQNIEKVCKLPVTFISQFPELPTGCEVVSLAMVLNYVSGELVDKCDLSDNYLAKGNVGEVSPYKYFLGEPRDKDAYGCYAPVIVDCANKYIDTNNLKVTVIEKTGTPFFQFKENIRDGVPIIFWASVDMQEMKIGDTWSIDGEVINWRSPNHCLVLVGFDDNSEIYFVADPLKDGIQEYPQSIVEARYNENGMMAIELSKNS